jgi:6,7-dimethyl-8-ribityllumazine synthase
MSEYKEYAGHLNASGLKFGIVISRFNDLLTGQLLRGALDGLVRHGARESDVAVAWVPGAYEIPMAANAMATGGKYNAVIALGAVIHGATPHADLISQQVTRALTQIALQTGVPVIDGVVTADNLDQAIERCGTKSGNRGWYAAQAAIEMANLKNVLLK